MMGYKAVYCQDLKRQNHDLSGTKRPAIRSKDSELIGELIDPICVISNANEILHLKLGKFLDPETRSYFEMIARAAEKSKTLVEELRNSHIH